MPVSLYLPLEEYRIKDYASFHTLLLTVIFINASFDPRVAVCGLGYVGVVSVIRLALGPDQTLDGVTLGKWQDEKMCSMSKRYTKK